MFSVEWKVVMKSLTWAKSRVKLCSKLSQAATVVLTKRGSVLTIAKSFSLSLPHPCLGLTLCNESWEADADKLPKAKPK